MDSERHLAPQAEYGSEGIGPGTQVCDGPEVLEGGVFLLERVSHGVAGAVDGNLVRLDLDILAASDGFDEVSGDSYAGSGRDFREHGLCPGVLVDHYLYVLDRGTVVERNECDLLVPPLRPHPSFRENLLSGLHPEQVLYLATYYFSHILSFLKKQPSLYERGLLLYIAVEYYSAGFLAEYMILSAEQRLSSCFTSVMIPILILSSALMLTVMN